MKKGFVFIVVLMGLVSCNGGGGSFSSDSAEGFVCSKGSFQGGDGSIDNPYIVCSADHFRNIGSNLFLNFRLAKSIDMSGTDFSFGQFEGTLDGGGYTVSNFNISVNPHNDGTALFKKSLNATIKNITFANVTSSAVNEVRSAVVVGYAESTVFNNVRVENSSIQGGTQSGLIVGFSNGSAFSQTFTSGSVQSSSVAGGSVGAHIGATTRWEYMENRASVTSTGVGVVGGIAGQTSNISSIENCQNSGDISTNGNAAGGIIGGAHNANFSYLSNTGDVTGNANVGGIFGRIDINSSNFSYLSLSDSSSVGDLEAVTNVLGGIVGRVNVNQTITSFSFQNLDVRDVALLTVGSDYGAVFGVVENTSPIPSPYYCDDLSFNSNSNGTVNIMGPNSTSDVVCTNIVDFN